jgi:hypothetical protein
MGVHLNARQISSLKRTNVHLALKKHKGALSGFQIWRVQAKLPNLKKTPKKPPLKLSQGSVA